MGSTAEKSRSRFSPAERAVLAFTGLYMAVWLMASFVLQNDEFVFYFLVMCVLIVAVGAVHFRVRLHIGALWGLSMWGLAHMAGGLMPVPESWPIKGGSHVLYNWWIVPGMLKYDQLVHAYGFGLVTWICWQSLRGAFRSRGLTVKPTFGLLALCVAGGMGFGAANEVVEFTAALALPGTNVGGYENTGWDLVANLVGCLLAATAILAVHKVSFPQAKT
jgi:uncharacterized membrane protein YagU involved in acid resistance